MWWQFSGQAVLSAKSAIIQEKHGASPGFQSRQVSTFGRECPEADNCLGRCPFQFRLRRVPSTRKIADLYQVTACALPLSIGRSQRSRRWGATTTGAAIYRTSCARSARQATFGTFAAGLKGLPRYEPSALAWLYDSDERRSNPQG